tara:strand:+ start:130 stop:540 length:411 start_codon:yes stop_codon:yes gene_type:complete
MSVLELNGRVFDASTTGTLTLTGEGSATTDVTQGLAKSWINFNGKNTVAIGDSFNVGSLVDRGTSLYTQNFTTSMGNAVFAGTGSAKDTALDADGRNRMVVSEAEDANAAFVNTFDTNGAASDVAYVASIIFGDLA